MTTTTTVRIRLAPGVRLATGPASENQAAESSDDIALQSDSGRMTASSPAMRELFHTLGSTGLPVSRRRRSATTVPSPHPGWGRSRAAGSWSG